MSTTTKIEWTANDDGTPGKTWNPVAGCDKISDGCRLCYAEGIARRFAGSKAFPNGFDVTLHPARLTDPLRWRKPTRVFVNSMSDLFHERIPDDYIAAVFAVMAMTPQHTYMILTKRHGRMRSLLQDRCTYGNGHAPGVHFRSKMGWAASKANDHGVPGLDEHTVYHQTAWPLPNVVLGVSVEDQHWANVRIPALLETPAATRFISAEPLLGPIDLRRLEVRNAVVDCLGGDVATKGGEVYTATPSVLDQVVVGGESGAGAKPMDPDWARSIVEQCRTVPAVAFVKQLGSAWAKANGAAHPKGGDPAEWPEELRVRNHAQTAGAR